MSKEIKIFIGVFAASILVAFFIAKVYIPKAYVLWDEATHIYSTYVIYDSLQAKDFPRFWENTIGQVFYPPLQSLFFGPLLLLFGFSIEKLRTLSLFWYVFCALLIFLLGKKLGGKGVGLVSVFFFLFSPMTIFFSSVFMKEVMGATISVLTIMVYIAARRDKKRLNLKYFATGFLLFALFLTKYNYSGLIAGGIFLEGIAQFVFYRNRFKSLISNLVILFSFLLPTGWWILLPVGGVENKLQLVFFFLVDKWSITSGLANIWEYFLYFPRAVLFMYSPSIVVGYLLIASFFLALLYFRDYRIRVIWFVTAVNYIMATGHTGNLQQRYILTTAPFVFLLGGFILAKTWERIQKAAERPYLYGFILCVMFILGGKLLVDILKMPSFVLAMGAYTVRSPIFHQANVNEEVFNYNIASWEKEILPETAEKPSDLLDFVVSRADLNKPIRVIGVTNEFSPNYFQTILASERKLLNRETAVSLPYSSYVVTLELLPGSRFLTRDYYLMNLWQVNEIRKIEKDETLALIHKKRFKEMGVEVVIYGGK